MAQYIEGDKSETSGSVAFARQLGRASSPAELQLAALPTDHSSLRRNLTASKS